MIGEVVDSYRIISRLGAGGMGAVWLAEHILLGRRVAIKFLLPEVSQSPAILDRFFAEARAATRIADPGIVVIYDFGWHKDGAAYIVMEHLAGESLQARLRRGRFAVIDAVRVVQQAAMAMAVAHGAGIIHRDLKPDNLFLVPDPVVAGGERIKILDFGIAKLLGDEHGNPARTRTGMIMGTPTYMSPEQCRGAGDVDHRTDIYALGCVLFHLVSGRLPFLASTPGDMMAAHLREMPPLPSMFVPHIPIEIDTIVMRCLAKQADERYSSMTELVRALATAGGALGEVVSIAPVRASSRDSRPAVPGSVAGSAAGSFRGSPPGSSGPASDEPAVVVGGAETLASSGGLGPAYAHGSQPSTFSRSAGESMPVARRGGRRVVAVVALAALGSIVIAVVVASSKPTEPARAPGSGSERHATPPALPIDAPVDVTAPAVDAAVADAAAAAAATDAKLPGKPPVDAARPRPPPRDSAYDPYANP
jgi:serine/threonine-protein kinase